MGIGFDAKVISHYNASGHRRMWSYFKAFLKSLRSFSKESTMRVQMNGKSIKTQPFMFFVSNSKIMGYDISLTRMASLQDGLLDVVIIDNVCKTQILFMGLLVVLRLNRFLKKMQYYKTKELKIAFEDRKPGHLMQTDGELHKLVEREVHVKIAQGALNVLCPA
jgi:diacylglycerol kinase family enzyme